MALAQIDHVIVVMMENRSLDNMLGWLYADGSHPAQAFQRAVGRASMA